MLAWPRMRLTWAMSRPRSTMRWLAKVWRRSWKRSGARPSSLSPASSAAFLRTRLATFRSPYGVPRGREDPVSRRREWCGPAMGGEAVGELWDQRHLPYRSPRLRWHPPRRFAAMCAGELGSYPNQPGSEVDVSPGKPEELGDPQTANESGLDQDAPARRAGVQQPLDFRLPQHPSSRVSWRVWPLLRLK